MKTFIQKLTDELIAEHGEDLSKIQFIFPTRRAGLFFRKELATRLTKPVWAPVIYSIQDFIAEFTVYTIPDPLTLRFELYKIYNKFFPGESFDKFYPWGDLLLRDFDDLDRYLADHEKVFSLISDIREIDQVFSLPDEDMEKLRTFWKSFFDKDPSKLKTEFMNTWEHLGEIYRAFRISLTERSLAYEGMAIRELAERLSREGVPEPVSCDKIIFAGFYALSPAEEQIIQAFLKHGKAEIIWDADSYYADDPRQEAGTFLRDHSLVGDSFKWKEDYFSSLPRKIEIAGIPLQVGQAKYAGSLVAGLMKGKDFRPERTVVVIPDENLLFPVLYALPEELEDINVTMGYPLHATPVFSLFESLIALQRNCALDKEKKDTFYYRDVLNILNHPYIRLIDTKSIRDWMIRYEKDKRIRIPASNLVSEKAALFRLIFIRQELVQNVFEWGRKILRLILESMKEQEFRFHRLESEFVYQFYTQLHRLEEVIRDQEIDPGLETMWYLFREIIYSSKIPFTGEPLKGLQVMGFLETRVLDFDNVIILSVNEEVLPSSGNSPSFVPYSIRKAFGLPTYEEQHAVSAYHFYRLLQRATTIHLLYNTESKKVAGGEKSRFILQIEHELAVRFSNNIRLTEKIISTGFSKEKILPIEINKSPAVLNILKCYLPNANLKSNYSSKFSASALNAYIACPLRFYFQYVVKLSEKEEPEEHMDAATLGKVLHKAMQLAYSDTVELTKDGIEQIIKRSETILDQAIREEFEAAGELEGKNILLKNVIHELIRKIFRADQKETPFRIYALEKEVKEEFSVNENQRVLLHGFIDRIDESSDGVRIVDYKTGKIGKKKFNEIADLFREPAYKEQFQAMLYAYMVRNNYSGRPIRSGLITLKDMSNGIFYLQQKEPFTTEQFNEFELQLRALIGGILNPDVPFSQTKDETRCKWCNFTELCNR
ncbi:MAG TPA: PD-(D/E)XK nuclease family protein [Bacteroidia bacterium]|nr:PD-(D/E)XK nuclease family protein [Bacteroidia bacterium]